MKRKTVTKIIACSMALSMALTIMPAVRIFAEETSEDEVAALSVRDDIVVSALNSDATFYTVDVRSDYQLDELLAYENICNAEDLTLWVSAYLGENGISSRSIDMGDGGACSAFVANDEQGNLIYARNYDYLQAAQNALVYTHPEKDYASVSMAAGGWITGTNGKLYNGGDMLYALPYLAMDGMNEKGVMISVLKLDGEGAKQEDPSVSTIIPNIVVRLVLDKAASVKEALDLMEEYNICSSMDYSNFHYFIADSTGESAIVEVNPSDGSMSVETGNLNDEESGTTNRQITNFYQLYPSQDYNLDDGLHGLDRYMRFVRQLHDCDYTMSKDAAMALLSEAYQDNTADSTHETQWSVVYSPIDMTVSVSPRYAASDDKNTFYSREYEFDVTGMGSGNVNLNPSFKEGAVSESTADTGTCGEGERTFEVTSHTQTTYAGGQIVSNLEVGEIQGEWNESQIIQTLKDAGMNADLFKITYITDNETAIVTSSQESGVAEYDNSGSTEIVKFDGTLQGLIDSLDTDAGKQFLVQASDDIRVSADGEGSDTGTVTGNGESVILQMNGHRLYNDDGSGEFTLALNNLHLGIYMDSALADAGISQIYLGENAYIAANEETSDGLSGITSDWDQSLIGYGVWKNVDRIAVDRIIGGHFYNTEEKTSVLDVNTITGGTFGDTASRVQYPLVISGDVLSGTFLSMPVLEIINGGTLQDGTFQGEVILGQAEIKGGSFRNTVTAQYNEDNCDSGNLGQSVISGGVFKSRVINRGVITGGVFEDKLENDDASDTDYDGTALSGGKGGEITGGIFADKNNIEGNKTQEITFRKLLISYSRVTGSSIAGENYGSNQPMDIIPGTEVSLTAILPAGYRFVRWDTDLDDKTALKNLTSYITTFTMPDGDGEISSICSGDERVDYEISCAPQIVGFGTVRQGSTTPERAASFKNTGKQHFYNWEIQSDHGTDSAFDISCEVDNSDGILYRNSICTITVKPKENACVGGHSERLYLYVYDDNGRIIYNNNVRLSLDVQEYGMEAAPSELDFGTIEENTAQPEAKELTLKNKGEETIAGWKLTSDAETSAFTFSQTQGDAMEANASTVISVQPKENLAVGEYNETLTITYDEQNSLTVPVRFKVEAKKIICDGRKEVTLSEGTHQMTIGGTDAGTYTFAKSGDKWSIQNSEGKYIGFKNNAISFDEEPFYWIFKNKMFYTTVTEKQSSGWGWWSWGQNKNKTVNWFLIADKDGVTVSKSESSAKAAFYDASSAGEHSFGKWISEESGTHKRTCTVCGFEESGTCTYDEETHKCTTCGAADPANATVHVKVNVTKKTGSSGGWWFWSRPSSTTWTASIIATGEGVEISKVEYSTDQKTYKTGTSFTSNSEITTFYIRVTDENGNVTNWIYKNGTTSQL